MALTTSSQPTRRWTSVQEELKYLVDAYQEINAVLGCRAHRDPWARSRSGRFSATTSWLAGRQQQQKYLLAHTYSSESPLNVSPVYYRERAANGICIAT